MPADKLTSLQNPLIKKAAQLKESRHRKSSGLTLIEGVRELMCAVRAGVLIQNVFYCGNRPVIKGLSASIGAMEVSEAVFKKLAYGQHNQGVIAVGQPVVNQLSDFPHKADALYVVIEKVEKPGNLGAILRTCDGVGADGVILCDAATDIFNPNVIRASLGTIFSNRVVTASKEDAVRFLQERKVDMCAAIPEADMVYTKYSFKKAAAVIVGSEQDGLSDFWKQTADVKVSIPMSGAADSLNVSVSAAVILYEIIRQRRS